MIRFTFKYLKPVALFLYIVVLFQCCVVYDKQPVSIEQAINKDHKKQKRIKVDLVNGEQLILDSIYYKDLELYGLLKRPKEKKKVQVTRTKFHSNNRPYEVTYTVSVRTKVEIKIEEDNIVKIRLHNKSNTITLNFFLTIISLGVLTLGLYIATLIWDPYAEML